MIGRERARTTLEMNLVVSKASSSFLEYFFTIGLLDARFVVGIHSCCAGVKHACVVAMDDINNSWLSELFRVNMF
jgi:succinylglutamate desuccinylase